MKSVGEHIDSIGARAEHCESQGWARPAPASPWTLGKAAKERRRRAPLRYPASKDRGAAAAGRVANQERQAIKRSKAIPSGQVPTVRQIGREKQIKQLSETSKRASMRPEDVVSI